jgi:hypothetical protein
MHFVAPAAALGLARLLERFDEPARAIGLAGAAAAHPAADTLTAARARALRDDLARSRPDLPADPAAGERPLVAWAWEIAAGLTAAG